jgi:DNA polymerase III delta subunit
MMKVVDFLKVPVPPRARIFVITGEEPYLREQAVARIRESLPPDLEVQVVHGPLAASDKGVDLRDLLDDLRTGSLFGGERLVHLKDADVLAKENQAALSRFVAEGAIVQRFVVEAKALLPRGAKTLPKTGLLPAVEAAGGVVVTCDPLYDTPFAGKGPPHQSPLSRWVQDQATKLGKRISLEDAYVLHRLVGPGLRELDGELRKLALYVKDRKTITAEDIEAATGAGRLAPVFDLAEAVAGRDGPAVLEQSALLFERGLMDFSGRHVRDPVGIALTILAAVSMRLRKVFRVKEMMAEGASFEEAAKSVKHPAPFLDRLRSQIEAWKRPQDVRVVMESLVGLERGLKTGGPARILFDRFVVEGLGLDQKREAPSWHR